MPAPKPASIDDYLSRVDPAKRADLERLRAIIHSAAPDAVETIAYNMPAYRFRGRYFMGFAATARGCSFYTGRLPTDLLETDLGPYRLWQGTINYDPAEPIPEGAIRRLVAARVAVMERA